MSTSPPAGPSRTGDTTDRRAEIAAAAYRLVAARGLDGLSMRVLAREVGATTGLVTHHFLDRAEVIDAALEHAIDVMTRRVGGAASPEEAVASVLPTDTESMENWRFVLSVRAAALVDPSLRRFDEEIRGTWHRQMPPVLERASLPTGGGDVHDAVDHLIVVTDGIALQAIRDPAAWPGDRQRRHLRKAFDSL